VEKVNITLLTGWPDQETEWSKRLELKGYKRNQPNVIIFDEAQLSYGDEGLWHNYFKGVSEDKYPDRVILFASYGSPDGFAPIRGTPPYFPDKQRVDLRPVDHKDGISPVGLFLTEEEFDDIVNRWMKDHRFSQDFLRFVFEITAGHVGATEDMLRIVKARDVSLLCQIRRFTDNCFKSYRQLKNDDGEYSLDNFKKDFSYEALWKGLEGESVFRRGLPPLPDLQNPNIAKVFGEVFCYHAVNEGNFDRPEHRNALDLCWRKGWLHAIMHEDTRLYIFTTQLHKWYVEYYLGMRASSTFQVVELSLLSFVTNVIKKFSFLQLSSPRTRGPDRQRTPEAQYQDEFYRCCHAHTNGSLVTFPEFGDQKGRIDFYIPQKNWGVELLRDGDRLKNHSLRFVDQGAYTGMNLEDYIILDFRTIKPQKGHPGQLKFSFSSAYLLTFNFRNSKSLPYRIHSELSECTDSRGIFIRCG
jgi:hypothetical protein